MADGYVPDDNSDKRSRNRSDDEAGNADRYRSPTRFLPWLLLIGALAGVAGLAWAVGVGGGGGGGPPHPIDPPQAQFEPTNLQAHQKTPLPQDVRDWRKAAWQRDDQFAQLKLGDLYSQDQSFYDPVEAVVWYFLAARPGHRFYTDDDQASDALHYLLEKGRHNYANLITSLTLDQREDARKRIIYILANRQADGFITLGQLHRTEYYPPPPVHHWYDFSGSSNDDRGHRDGDRSDADSPSSVLITNDADALMYFYIAQKKGHPLADAYINSETNYITQELPNGTQIPDATRSRADNWLPAFEYYPGQTRGGLLHTDESVMTTQDELVYALVGQIPPPLIAKALWIVGVAKPPPAPCGRPCRLPTRPPTCCELRDSFARFQELIGHDQTGVLSPAEIVRLIRMAALNGDAEIQNELGIMYTKGIGVPINFPRAQNWFDRAGDQRYGEALYNEAILYKVGINGIPHDEDKAARLIADSAIAGFNPARCQLLYLLNSSPHDRPDH